MNTVWLCSIIIVSERCKLENHLKSYGAPPEKASEANIPPEIVDINDHLDPCLLVQDSIERNIVSYIAGSVLRKVMVKTQCEECKMLAVAA